MKFVDINVDVFNFSITYDLAELLGEPGPSTVNTCM